MFGKTLNSMQLVQENFHKIFSLFYTIQPVLRQNLSELRGGNENVM
jgi:hypothetical protein